MTYNGIQDLFNVDGLVAVVTGGGSGLGLYAAKALDANGAKAVYIVGRRQEVLQRAASEGKNGRIIPIVGDVTDKASLGAIAERVRQEQGFVNLVFANAGVLGPVVREDLPEGTDKERPSIKDLQAALWKPAMENFTSPFSVNVTAAFYTAVAFLDLLDAGNKQRNIPQDSQFIVTSSISGFSRHLATGFAYGASKAGANHVVKMLSTMFAKYGYRIRANIIAPGFYPSEMTDGMTSNLEKYDGGQGHEADFADAYKLKPVAAPAERTGSEQDFAGTILFMASRAGAYLNGETLVTDGGRLSQLPAVY